MKQTEHQLQVAVSAYLDRALPPDAFWTSIDSAGRGPRDGARMKRRGVRKGTADILIIYDNTTAWLELKSAKGRLTPEQQRFAYAVLDAGHHYFTCRSVENVELAMAECNIPLRARIAA